MKRIITLVAVIMVSVPAVFAQDKDAKKDDGWRDRVKADQIAFISADLGLTPEEAQNFWPVYNKYNDECNELNKAVRVAYKELTKALEEGNDVEAKLDAYVKALDAQKGNAVEASKAYKKVLPVEKVAKLYVSEEKFRFQQIEKLHLGRGPQNAGPQRGDRPQGGPQGGPRQKAQEETAE